jgi:hypothetical protein
LFASLLYLTLRKLILRTQGLRSGMRSPDTPPAQIGKRSGRETIPGRVCMASVELLLIPLAFLILGLAVGRWWFTVVPILFWVALGGFLLINNGWHGAGWGEFGVAWNVIMAVLTVVTTLSGVALRELTRSL